MIPFPFFDSTKIPLKILYPLVNKHRPWKSPICNGNSSSNLPGSMLIYQRVMMGKRCITHHYPSIFTEGPAGVRPASPKAFTKRSILPLVREPWGDLLWKILNINCLWLDLSLSIYLFILSIYLFILSIHSIPLHSIPLYSSLVYSILFVYIIINSIFKQTNKQTDRQTDRQTDMYRIDR